MLILILTLNNLLHQFYRKKPKKINTVNHNKEQVIPKFKEEVKVASKKVSEPKKVNSTYILARMEKVRFFRSYFLKY